VITINDGHSTRHDDNPSEHNTIRRY
jgi:hypothetical protein